MERQFLINEDVKGVRGSKSKYLYSLFRSICQVDKEYIQWTYYASTQKDERTLTEENHVEHVFAYELYHQWSNDEIIRRNPELMINSELPKQLVDYDKGDVLYYPDMVLHMGQGNPDGNIIVCEIKRKIYIDNNPTEMINDFKKIRLFLDINSKAKLYKGWKPFKFGVFIAVVKEENMTNDLSIEIISKHINKEIKNIPEDIKKRIFCVVYNGNKLLYDSLFNMTK